MVREKSKAKSKPKTKALKKEQRVLSGVSLFTEYDIHLFKEGNQFSLFDRLGSHVMTVDGKKGVYFAVWAPNAEMVSVVGNFNFWKAGSHQLYVRWDSSGIWEGFIPGIEVCTLYKYHIKSTQNNYSVEKADPYAYSAEVAPKTASVVWDLDYKWNDASWMRNRGSHNSQNAPISIYEMHLGSWRKVPEQGDRSLSYREMAPELVKYMKEMGYTHVQFLPVMEHPYYASWGYQMLGFFAPTSRFGIPQDLMYLIDVLHQNDIGVIMDWVPSHFPEDNHGLSFFDGTYLYEHGDPKKGYHPDWKSYIFNYNRNEVRSFLINSALFWFEKYHIDGLRVDAVASMLYLDYSRKEGEWIPNEYGGRENIPAIYFLKKLNEEIYLKYPDVITIAEESTAWPMVSKPTYLGGLGFGLKWNMGWMHDTLVYFGENPVHRKYHHNQLTFSLWYAFAENFCLVLSHDEVVHGKNSLIGKMPGDYWQQFANLRAMYGFMYGHPGKKLLFMGGEFGQWSEWNHDKSLDWSLLEYPIHEGISKWVRDLNNFYRNETVLYEDESNPECFEWIDFNDWEDSVVSFLRKGKTTTDLVLVACNFTPVPRHNYRIGVPKGGLWKEVLNSDSKYYGGSGQGNTGGVDATPVGAHGRYYSVVLTLPPLSVVFFTHKEAADGKD